MNLSLAKVEMDKSEPWSVIEPDLSRIARSWLLFKRDPEGQTFISRQRTEYPFHMTKPFRIVSDPIGMLTLYLQSSSGGLYRGDRLTLDVSLEPETAVHLTTQAGTVVHHSRGGQVSQTTNLRVAKGGYLEYLPDPLILLTGANVKTVTRAICEPGATLLLAESFTSHDPDGLNTPFERLQSELSIQTGDGELLALDRFDVSGKTFLSGNSAVQGNQLNQSSVFLVAPDDLSALVQKIQNSLKAISGVYGGVSMLPNKQGIWCRFLADDGVAQSIALKNIWGVIRTELSGSPPSERRK